MTLSPMQKLADALNQNGLVRYIERLAAICPTGHLKDVAIDEIGPGRVIEIMGRRVVNFGSDSFLGLDQHPKVKDAVRRGVEKWGTHNGASRAFSSVRANVEAEKALAEWLGVEAVLVYPSVTLANLGALPGLVGRADVLAIEDHAHNSIHEGARIARTNGVRVLSFSHRDPQTLDRILSAARPYRSALVALDGVYSMTGEVAPLVELNHIAVKHGAVLYVDDAHGSGIIGKGGRGTVFDQLGSYENALVVGSLSKALSCAGGYITCTERLKRLLKMRSNTYVFGGPIPPPYLEAICAVCEIFRSPEFDELQRRLRANIRRFVEGAACQDLSVLGGRTPILSVLVGDEEGALKAGHALFEHGYYVQSVTFPAVPYHAAVLRVQVNANHTSEQIDGLLHAFKCTSVSRRACTVNTTPRPPSALIAAG